ncbi:Tyrosyl-DNA phosphodiesterase 1 [Auxenochlorella protothecoides]|uniref:Tyrosyl-DNA phosphodiesterase 1 n=1 Tax=Auxenochlorella protothecoides TaxID=3075 RepID=A0A087STC0_AUXPR|nr:Tyrosyl-DNA phosphodiesterase 1 [Auxenochlorella protothecoides]KFM28974.1 Tyrosyl-DNA phosphodiesterase 1 [Auxenochlorella protothecoides]
MAARWNHLRVRHWTAVRLCGMPKRAVSPELVDLTSSPKRQLVDASSHAAVPEERQCVRAASSSHRWPDSPFHLMRVRGLPTWANEGSLGIKLSEVVAGPMRTVLISNYMLDFAWLLSACPDLARAERLIIVHGEGQDKAAAVAREVREAGLASKTTIHQPPLPIPYGTHHSKAFVILFERGVRVVVHTANLIYPDCNNKTQALYTQDFPPAPDATASPFQESLLGYLARLRIPASAYEPLRRALQRHNFSCARAALVASVPGYHQMGVWVDVAVCLSTGFLLAYSLHLGACRVQQGPWASQTCPPPVCHGGKPPTPPHPHDLSGRRPALGPPVPTPRAGPGDCLPVRACVYPLPGPVQQPRLGGRQLGGRRAGRFRRSGGLARGGGRDGRDAGPARHRHPGLAHRVRGPEQPGGVAGGTQRAWPRLQRLQALPRAVLAPVGGPAGGAAAGHAPHQDLLPLRCSDGGGALVPHRLAQPVKGSVGRAAEKGDPAHGAQLRAGCPAPAQPGGGLPGLAVEGV